jgi:glycosyltransferase involved in cell wall biosynthesis
MRIAQVYPHSDIPLPQVRLYDALAIVNYELGRRLAREHEVITYPKRMPGEAALETFEGVTYRRIPQRLDQALGAVALLDALRPRARRGRFRLSSLYYAHYVREAARDIAARDCDLVHLHTINSFILPLRRRCPRARIVLHVHDHSLADFDAEVLGPRLKEAALVLACSRYVTDGIRRRFPALAPRCHTLYNGVDQRFLALGSDPAASRTVLFVGRLCPEKGVHVLLSAMRSLIERQSAASVSLVGPFELSPQEFVDPLGQDPVFEGLKHYYDHPEAYYERIRREAACLGGHAVLEGPASNADVGSHYARAGLFVFPSLWHEPFGIPVIEAMAAGLPVIATRGGALPEIVVDGETGLLVERGDAAGLAAAIARLLSDPPLRARMGVAGRARVRELFTWDRSVARLQELYGLALRGPASSGSGAGALARRVVTASF